MDCKYTHFDPLTPTPHCPLLVCPCAALCGLAGMSTWSGIHDSLLLAAQSGFKCTPDMNCPEKGFSYYLTALAVFVNAGATGVFIIQPRFVSGDTRVCTR